MGTEVFDQVLSPLQPKRALSEFERRSTRLLHSSAWLKCQLLLYVVWFHTMFALACWIAVFYDDMQSAVLASVAMLIFSGLVANLVVVQFVESGPAWVALLLEALAPPFALFRALWEASQYAFLADSRNGKGLTVDHINDEDNGFGPALGFLAAHTVIGLWCAYYWEQVFVEGDLTGPRKHPFFPLGFTLKPEDPRGFDWFWSKAQHSSILLQHNVAQLKQHWLKKPVAYIYIRGHFTQKQHSRSQRETNSPDFARCAVSGWHSSDNGSLEQVLTDLDGRPIQDVSDAPRTFGSDQLSRVSERNDSGSSQAGVNSDVAPFNPLPTSHSAVEHHSAGGSGELADNEHIHQVNVHIGGLEDNTTIGSLPVPERNLAWDVEAERKHAETVWRLLQETNASESNASSHAAERKDQATCFIPPAVLMCGVRRVFVSYAHDVNPVDAATASTGEEFQGPNEESQRARRNLHTMRQDRSYANQNQDVDNTADAHTTHSSDTMQNGADDLDHQAPNTVEAYSQHRVRHRWRRCEHVAVRGLWLVVERSECFGLLGPNGAGKTTTLRLMQGLLEVSNGSVAISGQDVFKHPEATATQCGICPQGQLAVGSRCDEACPETCQSTEAAAVAMHHMQHDVLWPALSCTEHLYLYGRLRGLRGEWLAEAVQQQLTLLGLADVVKPKRLLGLSSSPANRPCSTLSGGMRRRLSVGCALLGFPPVVFLDEPSAGLDPASRSALWQAIRTARQQGHTAAILSTHSMAEAEALCDRIGILVAGQLQCIGSPQELTARYSHSLLLAITCPPEQSDSLQEAVLQQACPEARLVTSAGGAHQWEVPKERVTLAHLFATVQRLASHGSGLHVSDWGISSATLDHVFSAIIAKHEGTGQAI